MDKERYAEIRLAALAKIAVRDAVMRQVSIEELCSPFALPSSRWRYVSVAEKLACPKIRAKAESL